MPKVKWAHLFLIISLEIRIEYIYPEIIKVQKLVCAFSGSTQQ